MIRPIRKKQKVSLQTKSLILKDFFLRFDKWKKVWYSIYIIKRERFLNMTMFQDSVNKKMYAIDREGQYLFDFGIAEKEIAKSLTLVIYCLILFLLLNIRPLRKTRH